MKKRALAVHAVALAVVAVAVVIGCAAGGGGGGEGYYVTFTIDGDREVTWTKGDTVFSPDAFAYQDTEKGSTVIGAFPVVVSGVYNVHNDVDNGIQLLIKGLEPGAYTGEDIQTSLALDGTGFEIESSGTIVLTSIGEVGDVVEGTFELVYTSPAPGVDITNGRFRVIPVTDE